MSNDREILEKKGGEEKFSQWMIPLGLGRLQMTLIIYNPNEKRLPLHREIVMKKRRSYKWSFKKKHSRIV